MNGKSSNMYYCARMAAAAKKAVFSNRERAAGELYVSAEALADYETGKTIPPCDVVQRMVEVYGAHDLRAEHIRACCPLITDYGSDGPSHLSQAALGWAVALGSVQDVAQAFARVARDGEICPEELPAARMIRTKAVEIMQVMQETITAIDKAMGGRD